MAAADEVEAPHHLLQIVKHGCSHVSCSPTDASQSFDNEILKMKILWMINQKLHP